MDMVLALMVKPGEHPSPALICGDRDYLRQIVSVGTVLTFTTALLDLEDGIAALFNMDGPLLGLPGNRRIGDRIITGDFYIVRYDSRGKLISLRAEDVVKCTNKFWHIEEFSEEEILDAHFERLGL